MADTIFTTQVPNDGSFDAAWHTLGQRVRLSSPRSLIGGRAWFPLVAPLNFFWVVWRISDQVIMAQVDLAATFPIPTLGAWNTFTSADFDTPGDVALEDFPVDGEEYACAVATDGDFVFRSGDPTFPIGTGVVSATEALFHNGGAGPVFPTTGASDVYFFADWTVDTTGVDATMAFTLPLPDMAFTVDPQNSVQLTLPLPLPQFAATADPANSAALALPLPRLGMALTAFTPPPPLPSGTGSLTISVDTYFQLTAPAQRLLCWAGQPAQLETRYRTASGLPLLQLPEVAFGAGPLALKTGGPDIMAGYVTGEHRQFHAGNAQAADLPVASCSGAADPHPISFITRVAGNPFAVTLDYSNFAGNGPVDVLWGDGTIDVGLPESGTAAHTYPGESFYTITVRDEGAPTDNAVFVVVVP